MGVAVGDQPLAKASGRREGTKVLAQRQQMRKLTNFVTHVCEIACGLTNEMSGWRRRLVDSSLKEADMPKVSTTPNNIEDPGDRGPAVSPGSTDDFVELEFAPLTPNEVANIGDRSYLIGVHADRHRYLP